jgi:hypothetical protein
MRFSERIRCKLKQRVEIHKLNACFLIYTVAGNLCEESFLSTFGMRVAVAERIGEHFALAVETYKIDAPGIDTDRADDDFFVCNFFKSFENGMIKRLEIPVEMSVGFSESFESTSARLNHGLQEKSTTFFKNLLDKTRKDRYNSTR